MSRTGTTFWDTAEDVLTGVTQVVSGVKEIAAGFEGDGGQNLAATQGQITGAVGTTTVSTQTQEKPELPFKIPFNLSVSPQTIFLIGGGLLALLFVAKRL